VIFVAVYDGYTKGLLDNIGYRLKFLRDKHKVKIDRLSEVLGVTRVQYHKYEKGESQISIVGLKRIADFYNVSLEFLTNNHLAQLTNAVFFNEYHLDPSFKDVIRETKVHISDEYSSIYFVKDGNHTYVFEAIQDSPGTSGVYFYEYDSKKYMSKVILPTQVQNKPFEALLFFSDSSHVIIRNRNDVFFMGRLIGEYLDIQPGKFIKK
jgi:transcriptional regulator with XRE-family HTH domain